MTEELPPGRQTNRVTHTGKRPERHRNGVWCRSSSWFDTAAGFTWRRLARLMDHVLITDAAVLRIVALLGMRRLEFQKTAASSSSITASLSMETRFRS